MAPVGDARAVALDDPRLDWVNAVEVVNRGGSSPRRFSRRDLGRLSALSARRASAATGVRIRFRSSTDALRLACTIESLTPGTTLSSATASVELDHRVVPATALASTSEAAADTSVREFSWTGLGPGDKHLEIWLPHDGVVTVEAIEVDGGATLAATEPDDRPVWVHHGSSVSHAGQNPDPALRWPAAVARRDRLLLRDLSIPGECQIDQFVARQIRDTEAAVISLELGVNVVNRASMTERTLRSAVHGFIDTIRDGHPTTPVIIVSPITFPVAEQRPGPTPTIDGRIRAVGDPAADGAVSIASVRELLAGVVDRRRAEGDGALAAVDGRVLVRPDEADLLVDGLHPGTRGGELIAARFDLAGWRAPLGATSSGSKRFPASRRYELPTAPEG